MNPDRSIQDTALLRQMVQVCSGVIAFCLASWALTGCDSSQSSQERAPHREPANRPADLGAAWQRLQSEREQIEADLASLPATNGAEGNTWSERRARIAELVDWLPELAADSDLSEAQWQQVQTAAASFSERLGALPVRGPTLSAEEWQKVDLAELLRQIEPVVSAVDHAKTQLNWLNEQP